MDLTNVLLALDALQSLTMSDSRPADCAAQAEVLTALVDRGVMIYGRCGYDGS